MADISRSDVSTLIEEAYANTLLDSSVSNSVALQAFRRVDMGTKTVNLPVISTLPEADFVGESATQAVGVKPTSEVNWGNKQLVAEEIAVIIPVHENVVDDATEDILEEITRQAGAAIARKFDGAVIFGSDKPASWTSNALSESAAATGQQYVVGTDENDLGGCILQAAEAVDVAGWTPTALVARRGLRYRLANIRAEDGTPIFLPSLSATPGAMDTVQGLDAYWASGRIWNNNFEAFVVDPERVVIGVRQDITVKLLEEATVGSINLAERDMVALRFKARMAYALGDGTNAEGDSPQGPVAAVVDTGS